MRKAIGRNRRSRRKCMDNIKMDLVLKEWGGLDWIGLAQDGNKRRALVNAVMNHRFS
jgi:hypothetical protein